MNTAYSEIDEQGGGGLFSHLPAIISQRRWFVIVPFFIFGVIGVALAYMMPQVYRSTAVLLVESQELPKELVGSPVTAMIDQRIARIEQQVLSRGDLINLIQQHGLYENERKALPLSLIVETMRQNTLLETVSADMAQSQNASNTIAFSLSFDYPDPVKAQNVVQSYVDSFLSLSATQTAEQAESTVAFLSNQATELQQQIAAVENQITSLKAQNGAALASVGILAPSNPGSYDAQIASLQRENAVLAQQASETPANPLVAEAEAALAAARAVYNDSHPDVRVAVQRLEQARRMAASNRNNNARSLVETQIAANNAQISALTRTRAQELARSSSAYAAQARAPVVLEEVSQLESRASMLREQYDEVSTNLLNARGSARMERQDKGERLSVSEPPIVPEQPESPNPLLLMLGGWIVGAGIGLVLAVAVELLQRPIRGVEEIERLLGSPPLGIVPTIRPQLTLTQRLLRRLKGQGRRARRPQVAN